MPTTTARSSGERKGSAGEAGGIKLDGILGAAAVCRKGPGSGTSSVLCPLTTSGLMLELAQESSSHCAAGRRLRRNKRRARMTKTAKRRKAEMPTATPTPVGSGALFGKESIIAAGLYGLRQLHHRRKSLERV